MLSSAQRDEALQHLQQSLFADPVEVIRSGRYAQRPGATLTPDLAAAVEAYYGELRAAEAALLASISADALLDIIESDARDSVQYDLPRAYIMLATSINEVSGEKARDEILRRIS